MAKHNDKNEGSEVLIEEVNGTGIIRISEDVIVSVVKHYTLTVPGVISFAQSGFASGLADLLTRKPAENSVTLEMEGDYVNISVALIVRFGVSVPEIAAEVQSVISSKVEELTGKVVNKVDVTIRDLAMEREKDDDQPSAGDVL